MEYILHNAEAVASAFEVYLEKIKNKSLKLVEAKELIQGYAKLCHIAVDMQPEDTFMFDADRYKNLEENWNDKREACYGKLYLYANLGKDIALAKINIDD